MKKQFYKKLSSLVFLLLASSFAFAQTYVVDGINYSYSGNNKVRVIGKNYPFYYAGEIIIPSEIINNGSNIFTVTSIGYGAFYQCTGLTSINIPNSVTSIQPSAFIFCTGLKNINIPNSVTIIDSAAFSGCSSLNSATLSSSLTYIGEYAFRGCTSLTSITIPKSVTSIGTRAFKECTSLTSITLEANSPITITSSVFERVANTSEIFAASIYNTATLYVPAGSKTAYQNDPVWGKFTNIVESPVTSIETINSSNFNIYPNPTTDNVSINFTEAVSGSISLVDLHGNVVATKSISGNTSNISTSDLASGVYVVKINSDKGVAVKQLVIE